MKIGYDVMGNIAILKFDRDAKLIEKKKFALDYLKKNKNIRTVLEKTGKFRGRLRTQKTKWLAGEKTKEALYRENGCEFRLNVETCYFSPRLSTERKEVASYVKKGEKVLVMFGGVAPFAVVIAKLAKPLKVFSVELGRASSKYALQNVKRNKLNNVEIVQGDVRKKVPLLNKMFDRIVMARPQLKEPFLDVAFSVVRKNGVIHYYGFSKELLNKEKTKSTKGKDKIEQKIRHAVSEEDINNFDGGGKKLSKVLERRDIKDLRILLKQEAEKAMRKIKILKIKKAGDIGPYRFRYRFDFKVLN